MAGMSYNVVISDQLREGFDLPQVLSAFSLLFNVPVERAAELMRSHWVIKEGVDRDTAELYRQQLESIGLVVAIKEKVEAAATSLDALSLVPLDDEAEAESAADMCSSATEGASETCPKCGLAQPPGGETCLGCGVILHKVAAREDDSVASTLRSAMPARSSGTDIEHADAGVLNGKGLAVAAVAAFIAAIAWKLIADATGYEWGLVAWVVGGLVGLASSLAGNRGVAAGITCGTLALLAIFGGKYLIYSDVEAELAALIDNNRVELQVAYEQELTAAKAFAQITDGKELRRFMVDYGYSDAVTPGEVSKEEVTDFLTSAKLRLNLYALAPPSFEDWVSSTVGANLPHSSTGERVIESLEPIDLLFLLLGVATAFRLGRGGRDS